ncbi:tumor necrosis factor ligand superfamily member 13B-like [Thalassophryne amazonica]|uniref:tumor necrosis factor ligand superfamily member 13B-like n=1 Tax=Thalassophryne amazonica TaxID=390379 RepID=UPI00147217FB|nr:tumor necrosis factor ligand superfamily member 13B-like [Thalassophryne amazonica]
MLYNTLLLLLAFTLGLSIFLVYKARASENEFLKLQGDILQLNPPRSEEVDGKTAKISKTKEDRKTSNFQETPLKRSFSRVKREQGGCGAPTSLLQLTANSKKKTVIKGNVIKIPWSVSVQQGNAVSPKKSTVVVQEDGFYFVFGQVLFQQSSTLAGHVVRRSSTSSRGSAEVLHCLQEMSNVHSSKMCYSANTCYSAGIVELQQGDELELVVPYRPQILISMDADSTFFGVIQLN